MGKCHRYRLYESTTITASGAHPIDRDARACGLAAHRATRRADNSEWANSPPRNNHCDDGPSTRNHAAPMMATITATSAVTTAAERPTTLPTADRIGAVANSAPSSKLLARVSVPMYTRVGSDGSNSRIICSSESAEATMHT